MMTMGPWRLVILLIVVWGYGIQQGDWTLVSLDQGNSVPSTLQLYLFLSLGVFFLKSTLSGYCLCWWPARFKMRQPFFLSRQPQKSQFTREKESSTVVGFHRAREYTTCSLIRKRWIFCTGLSISPSLQGGTLLLSPCWRLDLL